MTFAIGVVVSVAPSGVEHATELYAHRAIFGEPLEFSLDSPKTMVP